MTQLSERAKILVVDDEPANLKVIREVLANDYRLSFAKSGELALQLIENEPPKLILLDIMMPGMTGFDFLEKVRDEKLAEGAIIIMLTNQGQQEDIDKAMSLGADGYIIKASAIPSEVLKKTIDIADKGKA